MATRRNKGFSLVELLAVVLVLAVLAAVAIPVYINTRKSAAARACKANLASIATAEAAFATRNGAYTDKINDTYQPATTPTGVGSGLIGAPEGLQQAVACPLDGSPYTATQNADNTLTIACPNVDAHVATMGEGSTAADWKRILPAPAKEVLP